jgi:ligand-binding sensor domain-containing protein/serine phosphatase RsbU (regulator of sigma subunit)/putative methionine-R-sulfoxide reductase with GAF domain
MKITIKTYFSFLKQVFLLASILLLTEQVFAQSPKVPSLSPDKYVTQFSIDIWGTGEGLPSRSLSYLEQTPDGYLWISSFQGLFRFDGVKFDDFDVTNTFGHLKIGSTNDFFQRADGTLCISTLGDGLLGFKNGKFKHLGYIEASIQTVLYDTPTHAWVATKAHGVYELNDSTFTPFTKVKVLNKIWVSDITKDREENLWFSTEGNGLVKIDKNGNSVIYTTEDGLNSNTIRTTFQDSQGKIWIGTNKGLCYFENNEIKIEEQVADYPINRMLEDYYGSLWLASEKGLLRRNVKTKEFEVLNEKNGLPHKNIQDILLDMEGNLWFTTYRAGLGRIQEGKFSNFTMHSGLASKAISAIHEVGKNEYLVATDVGIINKINQDKISKFDFQTNLHNARLKHINKDSKGNILISSYAGLLMISPDGTETLHNKKSGLPSSQIRMTFEDHLGNIWIGTRVHGLIKMTPDKKITVYNKENSDLSSNFIMSINQDNTNKLIIGTNDSGVNVIDIEQEGFSVTSYIHELTSRLVFSTYTDKENNTWITTNTGLNHLKDGKITHCKTKDGLLTGVCFDMIEDDNGYFWISTSFGVMRVSKQELNEFAAGKKDKITSVKMFNKSDGMVGEECTGAAFSIKTQGGILMFPTLSGVTFIDPNNIPINSVIPPITIEKLVVDDTEINILDKINIKPDKQRFTFYFTALSLIAPQDISLKYKLEGYDKDWTDSKGERQTVYTGLPYGKYTFRVKASNNDGIWNEEGEVLEFEVEPHFYQTIPFYVISTILLILLIYGGYRYRMRSVEREKAILEKLISERTEEVHSQKNKIEEQNKRLEIAYNDVSTLSKIGKEVTATLDTSKLNEVLYSSVNKLMKADGFGVGVYNKDTNSLDFENYIENGEVLPFSSEHLEGGDSFAIKCFKKQQIILVQDLDNIKKNVNYDEIHGLDPNALIYVPLVVENQSVGVVTVQSFDDTIYTNSDVTILQTLGSYIAIALVNADSYSIIENKNKLITDSIRYAERIQQAVLPSHKSLSENFEEDFILFSPKDIVSGDLYWFNQVGNKSFVAVGDCTGHGVPGAFMSMIGLASLNEIVNKERVYSPAKILTLLHTTIKTSLKQKETSNDDGMDIALCLIEKQNEGNVKITFSGAKRPLYYSEHGELKVLKGNRKSIGGSKKDQPFSEKEFFLQKGEVLYLFSDGIIDQHAPNRKRFGTPLLEKTLKENLSKNLADQEKRIKKVLKNHQQDMPQRDDIAMIGLRV